MQISRNIPLKRLETERSPFLRPAYQTCFPTKFCLQAQHFQTLSLLSKFYLLVVSLWVSNLNLSFVVVVVVPKCAILQWNLSAIQSHQVIHEVEIDSVYTYNPHSTVNSLFPLPRYIQLCILK